MHILISNDDGALAKGVKVLAETLSEIANITVVTPDRNRSGASNSLTLENALRVHELKTDFYAMQGTPVDCVHWALSSLIDAKTGDVTTGENAGLGSSFCFS